MPNIQHKRGTRAALDALAASSGLVPWQVYAISDESRLALALTTSTYQTFLKTGEGGGGGAGYYVGSVAPDPATYPLWFDTVDGVLNVWVTSAWVAIGPSSGGGGAGYYVGPTAPDPGVYPLWFNTTAGAFLVYVDSTWVEVGGGSSSNLMDGGSAASVYLASEVFDGGSASG